MVRAAKPASRRPSNKVKNNPRLTTNGSLGAEIDKIFLLQKRKDEHESKANALKTEIKELKEALLKKFKKSDLSAAAGKFAKCSLDESDQPNVEDWDKVYKYVVAEESFDLIQKRISAPAWRERLAAGKPVPGIAVFHRVDISVTRKK